MPPRLRKAIGAAALLGYLVAYVAGAIMLGEALLGTGPVWAQLAYFAVAGIAWVLPLKPLFGWMNGGGTGGTQ